MDATRVYLVAYDIADRRRWRRVFKLMKRSGQHVQLSVFVCRLSRARMQRLEARLAEIIERSEDQLLVLELTMDEAAQRLRGCGMTPVLPRPRAIVV